MRVRHLTAKTVLTTALLASTLALAGCGTPGSGGGEEEPTANASASGGTECKPAAGDQLVVLTDDKGLQNADNIIPAINKAAADKNPEIVDLLSSVSAALDTDKLIQLNKAVDIDRRTSKEVAKEFVTSEGLAAADKSGSGKLEVGAANFSENLTLAEIYGEVLRSAGFDVTVRSIGNRETYLPPLEKGELVAVPEYAATLADFLNAKINGAEAPSVASSDVDATVAALTPLAEQSKLVVGKASAAQDQNAFAVTKEFADAHKVTSLSELATACGGGLTLAGPPECPDRPFCQPGLEEKYGLSFTQFKSYDFGLIGDAVRKGDAAIGLVLSSDGSLAAG
ncbi:glycine betaine ABC transporter substrate-binding protein [Cellulomonas edaphi]|uniref:Glycine betaine ABC transporter substrate-binding protein n=1 Tax=Cellulomonas edaphi TaxID=3053468 RepID=A0ABT7SAE0_9CELL|nr:glycine betaine ABC transporter substrate-binding protein [Cellulomons edaphi]MDM7832595.1 glycine betaine ABC transporter substrate-binding protein [Cellulomons edaphi]